MNDMILEPRLADQKAPNLNDGEEIIAQFQGDKTTYIKEHVMLAALGSVGMVAVLMYMGNPHAWTGVVGAVFAIAIRGFYVASEQLGFIWTLTNKRLIGPTGSGISLANVAKVNTLLTAAQIVTKTGDKYMLKYQADAKETKAEIERVKDRA